MKKLLILTIASFLTLCSLFAAAYPSKVIGLDLGAPGKIEAVKRAIAHNDAVEFVEFLSRQGVKTRSPELLKGMFEKALITNNTYSYSEHSLITDKLAFATAFTQAAGAANISFTITDQPNITSINISGVSLDISPYTTKYLQKYFKLGDAMGKPFMVGTQSSSR